MNENLIGEQIPVSIISAYVIQWLKTQSWFPLADMNALWLNRITSGLAALVTAGAIHYTYGANGDFTINGNVWTLLHGLWAAVQQYALQHLVYKIAIAPPATPLLAEATPPYDPMIVTAPAAKT